ncbi:biotin--[acetyl-CoA-carboxylase] ligase [Oceanospirillum sediminis]|uniref:Bifunctional ligase/repressor BirA n=1 Tax=Oceanospirillum sediminis TaxID=2760088 RepID=A0A839IRL0_9GAMM|nr:biotin--[acetyl-CoA-carboxylase] ligase [Oceanospirillum sediminis]MBB1487320.1 biotin--[acetyl-CoA-carboxylase] ligase [Oceanospirillum sediminis]
MNNTELIRFLADGECHSGVELAEMLGISRAAIWKRLQKLEALGLPVVSEQGRGYRLAYPINLLDEVQLQCALPESADLQLVAITESTNGDTLQALKESEQFWPEEIVVRLTEQQTAGRGRRGRRWQSPFGANLYFSYGAKLALGAAALEGLSLAVGVLLADLIRRQGVDDVKVKWPNDVYIQGKKVAGILIEVDGDLTSFCNLVVGIGVNFSSVSLEGEGIDQLWTSLDQYGDFDRSQLAGELVEGLERLMGELSHNGKTIPDGWQDFDYLYEKTVSVSMGSNRVSGIAKGIDLKGNFILECDNGELKSFAGGEVSVRASE